MRSLDLVEEFGIGAVCDWPVRCAIWSTVRQVLGLRLSAIGQKFTLYRRSLSPLH